MDCMNRPAKHSRLIGVHGLLIFSLKRKLFSLLSALFMVFALPPFAIAMCCTNIFFEDATKRDYDQIAICVESLRQNSNIKSAHFDFGSLYNLKESKYLLYHNTLGCFGPFALGENLQSMGRPSTVSEKDEVVVFGELETTSYSLIIGQSKVQYRIEEIGESE